jgi:hypothetical protein
MVIGSNHEERQRIGAKVKEENGNTLRILENGIEYTLNYHESTSGKTWWYESDKLPVETVKAILPSDSKAINDSANVDVTLQVNMDMTCEFHTRRRRHEGAQWRVGQTIEVEEASVTIL